MGRPQREEQRVQFELSEAEAIVLFEWLANHDGKLPFDDHAEEKVLWRIEAVLESTLVAPFEESYLEQLANARNAVRGNE